MDARIFVVTHREYEMPDDSLYVPLMAGSALMQRVPPGYIRDDDGDNISSRNRNYCELTGLYYAWKNSDAEAIGLCHYRRLFGSEEGRRGKHTLLSKSEADSLMDNTDIVLPSPRRYYIETNYSQYIHAHHREDLEITKDIIAEKYPEYIPFWEARMRMTEGHRFNMFIMRREIMDSYCRWLFDILFELERRLDISDYSEKDRRVFGFAAERLLDIWVDRGEYRVRELPVIFTEKENIPVKAAGMLFRKIRYLFR